MRTYGSKARFISGAGLGILLFGAACSRQAGECFGSSAQAIYGGSPDASLAGLDNVAAAAVAAIIVESGPGAPSLCSGVLIAQRYVLTAAHCAPGAEPLALRVSFGANAAPFASGGECTPPAPTYPAVAVERDPDADIMLVELASTISPDLAVPIAATSPTIGQMAVIAGYGLNEQGTAGERRFVQTTVVDVANTITGYSGPDAQAALCPADVDAAAGPYPGCSPLIAVDSGADAGACIGDSGGPLFVHDPSGWQVAGILSEGSANCTGEDVYVDLASIATWINMHISS